MIMSEIFDVDLDYLKDKEVEDDQPVVKVEFSGQHTQNASNYGQISGSQGARNVQFGLKYKF